MRDSTVLFLAAGESICGTESAEASDAAGAVTVATAVRHVTEYRSIGGSCRMWRVSRVKIKIQKLYVDPSHGELCQGRCTSVFGPLHKLFQHV